MVDYVSIDESELPDDLIWTVPPANQGQIVEVAYADGTKTACAGVGSLYRRTLDRGDGHKITYAKRSGPSVAGTQEDEHDRR